MKDKYNVTHMWNIKKVDKPNQTNTHPHRPKEESSGDQRGGAGVAEMGKGGDMVMDGNETFGDKLQGTQKQIYNVVHMKHIML